MTSITSWSTASHTSCMTARGIRSSSTTKSDAMLVFRPCCCCCYRRPTAAEAMLLLFDACDITDSVHSHLRTSELTSRQIVQRKPSFVAGDARCRGIGRSAVIGRTSRGRLTASSNLSRHGELNRLERQTVVDCCVAAVGCSAGGQHIGRTASGATRGHSALNQRGFAQPGGSQTTHEGKSCCARITRQ